MAIPATDVPLFVTAGYFRLANADACGQQVGFGGGPGGPGGRARAAARRAGGGGPAVAAAAASRRHASTCRSRWRCPAKRCPYRRRDEVLDIRGFVRDERNQPFATIKQTVTVPAGDARHAGVAAGAVPDRRHAAARPLHRAHHRPRERRPARWGRSRRRSSCPNSRARPVKVSSVVMSTQLQHGAPGAQDAESARARQRGDHSESHACRDAGSEALFLLRGVRAGAWSRTGRSSGRTSTFYRGKVKVYETPVVERTSLDAADRKAAIFEFEVDAGTFTPGLYTCQVNVIDAVAGQFTLPRLDLYVRAKAPSSPD